MVDTLFCRSGSEFYELFISDLHLFHRNVTRGGKGFDDRPFDDLEEMLRAYNVGCMMPYIVYEPRTIKK